MLPTLLIVVTDKFPFGKPVDLRQVIHHSEHTLYYDAARKQPLWVSEVFTKQSLQGEISSLTHIRVLLCDILHGKPAEVFETKFYLELVV